MKKWKIMILALLLTGCGQFVQTASEKGTMDKIQKEEMTKEPQTEAESEIETEAEAETETEAEPQQIDLVMIGDMLMHMSVVNSGKKEDGTYNYDHLYEHVKDRISGADLAMVNQETILGDDGKEYSGYPNFLSPTAVGDAEVKAGFDVILQATNHALDQGAQGVINNISFWKTTYPQIRYLGIHDSKEDQENSIYLYEKDGMKIAILNYTYGTNGINPPSDMPYLVDYLDENKVVDAIEQAEQMADFTIVCPHWGTEYNIGTDSYQETWTSIFLEHGVDLVIGTHPHVIEPIEWVTREDGKKMLVYYSLGNFINGTSTTGEVANRMVGGMAKVSIGRNSNGEVEILDYDIEAMICHIADGTDFTVYPLCDYSEELARQNKIRRQASNFSYEYCCNLTQKVWGKEN